MKNHKIFVLVPDIHRPGGIANYYRVLRKHLNENFEYIYRGKKRDSESKLMLPFRLILDYINFCSKVWFNHNRIVVNTSLGGMSSWRDGIYMILSPFSSEKIVFFRGWDPKFQKLTDSNGLFRFWIKHTFLAADKIIVLSAEFKTKLIEWGYEGVIEIDTTVADEELLNGSTWKNLYEHRKKVDYHHILYLGSVIKEKGIWEITEAFKHLKDKGNLENIKVTIAGDGTERESLIKFTHKHDLPLKFPGYISGGQKAEILRNASIFLFASYHEGMPNAVLEAMAFGLPVITTPVGGLPEFFEEGKMGLLLESKDPEYIAHKISYLLQRPELMKSMSACNYNYAREYFYSEKVADRLTKIIGKT
jgi:glycosyltransferase involved in cell wall biosynthesis